MNNDEMRLRLGRLETRQEALIAGCAGMNETLETVVDAVTELTQAVNKPPSGDLNRLLEQLVAGLHVLTEGFAKLDRRVAELPDQLARAVR